MDKRADSSTPLFNDQSFNLTELLINEVYCLLKVNCLLKDNMKRGNLHNPVIKSSYAFQVAPSLGIRGLLSNSKWPLP